MIVAVLDTNVLASGFIGEHQPDSIPGMLVRRWRSEAFHLVTSEYILGELTATFNEPYLTHRLSAEEIGAALGALRSGATMQPITVTVAGIASHEEDDPILATAPSAGADYLVTGDKELRQLGAYGGTRLLIPREFVAVLDRAGAG